MANIINVTIASTNPPLLAVNDAGGQNNVNQSPNPQTIKWQLTGNAAQAAFLPMTSNPPGFSWITKPSPQQPNGPFGAPVLGANGNSLTITDDHSGSTTNGSWIYMLRAMLDGVIYTTTASTGIGAGVDNPIIINR